MTSPPSLSVLGGLGASIPRRLDRQTSHWLPQKSLICVQLQIHWLQARRALLLRGGGCGRTWSHCFTASFKHLFACFREALPALLSHLYRSQAFLSGKGTSLTHGSTTGIACCQVTPNWDLQENILSIQLWKMALNWRSAVLCQCHFTIPKYLRLPSLSPPHCRKQEEHVYP